MEMVKRGGMLLPSLTSTRYDLVSNICHDVDLNEDDKSKLRDRIDVNPVALGSYRIYIRCTGDNTWYEIQELVVKSTQPELVPLSESSILLYERKE